MAIMPANDPTGIPMDAILKLLNKTVISVGDGPGLTVLQIAVAVVTLLAGIWLSRWAERKLSNRLEQKQVDPGAVQLMRRLFYIVVILVLAATALSLLGIPLGAFAFVSGAIAIGVGFGAQNVISNFISGWILLTERPVRVGDFIELGEMLGTVEAIYTRFTRVRRIDGVRLMIPNSQILENTIVNWTIVDRKLRSSVRVGVRYGSDVQKVRILLEEILTSNPDVLDDPAPVIIFEDFGDSALVFDAFFWIESSKDRTLRGVRSAIRFEVDRVFKENDIVIAFPQRDMHVDGSLKLEQ
ncbi:MAG: mechanosensitive ion channel [Gammaproteobacteria bacterium]|nr:mechanosensitive ion channel [Gammaproteobacteria bacterium]